VEILHDWTVSNEDKRTESLQILKPKIISMINEKWEDLSYFSRRMIKIRRPSKTLQLLWLNVYKNLTKKASFDFSPQFQDGNNYFEAAGQRISQCRQRPVL
jgi:hypothetical protein